MKKEKLLGFDARAHLEAASQWDRERRDSYLLRDVPHPLSVGVFTWPSLFDTGQGGALSISERQRLSLSGISTPEWIGANAGIWDNLILMRDCLAANSSRIHIAYSVIAISWLSRDALQKASELGPYVEPTNPRKVSKEWEFLGYDIADGSFVSGLSECAYDPGEIGRLRIEWAAHLNENHLFADNDFAFEFAQLSNNRVAEHAPFHVYGLYRIAPHVTNSRSPVTR
jgi:hypothetical protein